MMLFSLASVDLTTIDIDIEKNKQRPLQTALDHKMKHVVT